MSSRKKQQSKDFLIENFVSFFLYSFLIEKRKRQSSSPFKSQIAQRLEKLRNRKRDLWADDSDDEQSKTTNNKKLFIVLTDSEEERPKSRKKNSQNHVKNHTCLICSILSQLSSYNCCSEHLTMLKNPSDHQQQATNSTPTADSIDPDEEVPDIDPSHEQLNLPPNSITLWRIIPKLEHGSQVKNINLI